MPPFQVKNNRFVLFYSFFAGQRTYHKVCKSAICIVVNFTKETQPPHNPDKNHQQQIRSLPHSFLLLITYPFLNHSKAALGSLTKRSVCLSFISYRCVIWCRLVSVFLLSLNLLSVGFIHHIVAGGCESFILIALWYSIVLVYQRLFIHSFLMDIGIFSQFGAVMDILVCVWVHTCHVFVGYITRREIIGLHDKHIFDFQKVLPYNFSKCVRVPVTLHTKDT